MENIEDDGYPRSRRRSHAIRGDVNDLWHAKQFYGGLSFVRSISRSKNHNTCTTIETCAKKSFDKWGSGNPTEFSRSEFDQRKFLDSTFCIINSHMLSKTEGEFIEVYHRIVPFPCSNSWAEVVKWNPALLPEAAFFLNTLIWTTIAPTLKENAVSAMTNYLLERNLPHFGTGCCNRLWKSVVRLSERIQTSCLKTQVLAAEGIRNTWPQSSRSIYTQTMSRDVLHITHIGSNDPFTA